MRGCFRCELRDSYLHESSDPNPGGGGYLLDITTGTSDSLVENNISWSGNKVITMRASGGGNVVAYNYFDDAFGATYPNSPEAGLNAAHATTSNMELMEGNYTHQFKGDSYWGASINITVFRNQISTIRVAHTPLNSYASGSTPYGDYTGRFGVDLQAGSYFTNFVGNVIGFTSSGSPAQSTTSIAEGGTANLSLLSNAQGGIQTSFVFENLSALPAGGVVPIWNIGSEQDPTGFTWVASTYQTQLRQGNWDWYTQTQTWLGIGGTQGSPLGVPQTIPNSLYTGGSAPAFFGSSSYCPCTWPWVNPGTGVVTTLPAKARFDNGATNGFNSP